MTIVMHHRLPGIKAVHKSQSFQVTHMSDLWEGDLDSQILVSHGSEVTWTWVQVTHGFLEIFEKCFEGQLEGFKKEMFQKRYFQKRKFLKIAFLRCLKTFLKRKFPFLEIPFLEHFLFKTFQLALNMFFKIFHKSMSLYPLSTSRIYYFDMSN
jgi:hypothetical protein